MAATSLSSLKTATPQEGFELAAKRWIKIADHVMPGKSPALE
ncbi:hexameric tyrosine-coordinated heme protein [Shinella daejeonensis]|nr:hexameric tyrosine-coordinated heme protein [Shinella daejeonensis]MCP8894933.1 hexameric tyrosine-coordinated heme protein [Shinella daejeonensis]